MSSHHRAARSNAEETGATTIATVETQGSQALLSRRGVFAAGILALPLWWGRSAPAIADGSVRDLNSYRETLSRLAPAYRYALIDIRAEWCTVCHRIEREILAHPSVQELLALVPLIKVDVTEMNAANRKLLTHLRAGGPPTFFIVEVASGGEYENTRSLGSFKRRNLIRRLQPFALAMRDRNIP